MSQIILATNSPTTHGKSSSYPMHTMIRSTTTHRSDDKVAAAAAYRAEQQQQQQQAFHAYPGKYRLLLLFSYLSWPA